MADPTLIGAISAAGVAILAGVAGVVLAYQNGKKLDQAATRREDIAQAIVNPESPLPPTHAP